MNIDKLNRIQVVGVPHSAFAKIQERIEWKNKNTIPKNMMMGIAAVFSFILLINMAIVARYVNSTPQNDTVLFSELHTDLNIYSNE